MANQTPTIETLRTYVNEKRVRGNFARSLIRQHDSGRTLSAKQTYWVERLCNEADAQAEQTPDTAGEYENVVAIFNDVPLKRPTLTFPLGRFTVVVSKAGDRSRNPGHLYVKANDRYVGKVTPEGHFRVSRDGYGAEGSRAVLDALNTDAVGYITRVGQASGRCSCCARPLTDERSVIAGVGPICADRYGIPWG